MLAFTLGFCKTIACMGAELCNVLVITTECIVSDITLRYISCAAILNLDTFFFIGLTSAPFADCVMNNFQLQIDRTTSLKNSWATEKYTETKNKSEELEPEVQASE